MMQNSQDLKTNPTRAPTLNPDPTVSVLSHRGLRRVFKSTSTETEANRATGHQLRKQRAHREEGHRLPGAL